MLICLRIFVEWLEIGTCWNLENFGFSICTSSTTSWIYWYDFVATITDSIMETTSLVNTTCSTWMLLITWSRLGSGSSSMLPYVIVTSSSSPPLPPISSKHVWSSTSSKSLTDDPKVVLDFFLSGEVTSLGFNLSLGVGSFICIFS